MVYTQTNILQSQEVAILTGQTPMKPVHGIAIELGVLALLIAPVGIIQPGPYLWLYIILVELASTFLIHCPAHYLVGSVLGIRFTSIRLGRTTLAKVLPRSLSRVTSLIPILTLSTDKASLSGVSRRRRAYMYASGTVASAGSALVIATAASLVEPLTYELLAWLVALGYLAFDVVFSPKSGDLMRARVALRS
jgi:hypothetical protein